MSDSGDDLELASLKQWESDQATLPCSLCSKMRERDQLTAIVFEYDPKNANRYGEHATSESRLNVCLFVCATDASCKAERLPRGLRKKLRSTLGQWKPTPRRFAGEQIELVIKATHRMLSDADANAIRIIDLEQLCCYICDWEMKSPADLRILMGEKIWVLFEANKVKWFCNSVTCRRAIRDGRHDSLLTSQSSLTIPAGTELSELDSLPAGTSIFTCGDCSGASVADTCGPWKLRGTL